MKRYSMAGMAFVLALCGMVSVALAADYTGSKTTSTTSTPQIETAEGSLSSIDLITNSLTVTAKGKILNLAIDPKATTAWKGSQPFTLSQLKLGDQVKVRYASKDGRQICKSIEVPQATAAATAAASTTRQ